MQAILGFTLLALAVAFGYMAFTAWGTFGFSPPVMACGGMAWLAGIMGIANVWQGIQSSRPRHLRRRYR